MINKLRVIHGDSTDPYRNLATEQVLLERVEQDECILFLWQNRHTVVIGRNQNAWRECRLSTLEEDGGQLARRLSGGGAVYHDLGNLNFTFLVNKANYNLDRQLAVVVEACRGLNIPAEKSGRNDVLTNGRKFSGNAFYDTAGHAYHHGTLLIDADMQALSKYLRPSNAKLISKGITSVRARVINLREICPSLTVDMMRQAMISSFETVYGIKAVPLKAAALDKSRIDELTTRNSSWTWRLGQRLPFTCACEGRFSWGSLTLELQIEQGIIIDAKVWSDAMDWSIAAPLENALKGTRFTLEALRSRLLSLNITTEILMNTLCLLTEQVL